MKDPFIIIPARGGSKGIPGKNIKCLNGKPLIQYTIEAALKVTPSSRIVLSTDDEGIKKVGEQLGLHIPRLRPDHLATDSASTNDVLIYEINRLEQEHQEVNNFILLQPTSPFRNEMHIQEALDLYHNNLDMVASVCETKANPYYVLKEEDENGWLVPCKTSSITRRQDAPKVWELNGAIYIINTAALKRAPLHQLSKIKKYEMSEIASIDIDTPIDFDFASYLMAKKK